MFGIEIHEILNFFRQLGLAMAGAACLWGIFFDIYARKEKMNEARSIIFEWVSRRYFVMLVIGIFIAVVSCFSLIAMAPAGAHEGITLIPGLERTFEAIQTTLPIYIAWLIILFIGLAFKHLRQYVTEGGISLFYLVNFIFAAVLISLAVPLDGPLNENIFNVFHGFHSIFTLGTVLALDFLYLSSKKSVIVKQQVFPFFPLISAVIWIGLALDAISVILIFPEGVELIPRFFFAQTVVAILIMNGVLLSGVIARKILDSLVEGGEKLTQKWLTIALRRSNQ